MSHLWRYAKGLLDISVRGVVVLVDGRVLIGMPVLEDGKYGLITPFPPTPAHRRPRQPRRG
jgi:hypothetical protein